MISLIAQYKLSFILSWIVLCLIYPLWALPISVTQRFLVYSGLMIYFCVAAYVMDRWFSTLHVDKPIISKPGNFFATLKNHLELLTVCLAAVILHIFTLTLPIANFGDEPIHLQGGLWVYDYLGSGWHGSLQILLWGAVVLVFIWIWRKKGIRDFFSRHTGNLLERPTIFSKYLIVLTALSLFILYFLAVKDISYQLMLIRYPSTSKLLYLISYLFLGITPIGPRIMQLIFYALGGIYLYRAINLYFDKDAALLGTSIFFFAPPVFLYAQLAETASGVVFFMILTSFYFLRFLKNDDNRDLMLTAFFIGIGALFKQDILLMFFICSLYLVFNKLRDANRPLIVYLKVLLISLAPVVPWMIIGKFFNWRNYSIVWSHFTSLELMSKYISLVPMQTSWAFFILFVISISYILLKRRNDLSLFFGLVFLAYYLFYTADFTVKYEVHRFSVSLYPAIALFMSLFIHSIIKRIKWKYSFKIVWIVLSIYLIVLSSSPSLSEPILAKRSLHFPGKTAMQWIKENVKDGERILILRILSASFYIDAFDLDKSKFINMSYEINEVSTPESLKQFCAENRINYVMFPLSRNYRGDDIDWPGKALFEYIIAANKDEFMEVSKISMDDNNIYIYRINSGNDATLLEQ